MWFNKSRYVAWKFFSFLCKLILWVKRKRKIFNIYESVNEGFYGVIYGFRNHFHDLHLGVIPLTSCFEYSRIRSPENRHFCTLAKARPRHRCTVSIARAGQTETGPGALNVVWHDVILCNVVLVGQNILAVFLICGIDDFKKNIKLKSIIFWLCVCTIFWHLSMNYRIWMSLKKNMFLHIEIQHKVL